jgi:hypothetical protein
MSARIWQATGSYASAIQIIAVVMLVSLILPLIVRPPKAQAAGQPRSIAQAS